LPDEGGAEAAGGERRPALTLASFARPPALYDAVALEKLGRLISVTEDDDPIKPDVHLRRARLHAAHARELRASGDQAGATRALDAAVADHEAALATRSYARADENLYELVALLGWGHRDAQARVLLDRLVTGYPGSRVAADATLDVAEHLYDQRQFAAAAGLYARVVQAPRVRLSSFALYRQAWPLDAAGDHAGAEELFHQCTRMVTPQGEDPAIDTRVRNACFKDVERLRRR